MTICRNLCFIIFLYTWKMSVLVNEATGKEDDLIVFPDNFPEQKQEIPLSLVRRLNDEDISDMQDFIDNFVDAEPEILSAINPRFGSEDIERSAIKSARMARCMPELKTVPLSTDKGNLRSDSAVFYYPPCTRVERCGGCCSHRLLSCQPVESEILHFNVIVTKYKGGSGLKFMSKEVVEVEQHKKCKCDCIIQKEDCSRYQKYNKEKCSCECQNTDDERKCYQNEKDKIWNKDLCTCMCKQEMECGSGFYFDPFHCRCESASFHRRSQKQRQKTLRWDFNRDHYNVSIAEPFTSLMFKRS